MEIEKLLVLIINDMVIFPNNDISIEYDNTFDKSMINIIDKLDSDLMLIVNPIEEGEDIDLTNLPNYFRSLSKTFNIFMNCNLYYFLIFFLLNN